MRKLNYHARTTEVDRVSDMLLQVWEKATNLKDEAFLKKTFEEIKTLSDQITEAVKRDKALSNLDKMDSARDENVKALGKLIDGYAVIPVQEMKAHGDALKKIFKKYGNKITKESYANESALIESMLKDFSDAEAQKHVTALTGMADAISAIRNAQDAFDNAQLEYDAAKAKDGETATASNVKKPLVSCINDKLVTYLNTMVMVDAEKYNAFAVMVETEIERVNSDIENRAS